MMDTAGEATNRTWGKLPIRNGGVHQVFQADFFPPRADSANSGQRLGVPEPMACEKSPYRLTGEITAMFREQLHQPIFTQKKTL